MTLCQPDLISAKPLLTYDEAVAKGKKLQAAMLANDQTAGEMLFSPGSSAESRFLDRQQLEQHGYTRSTMEVTNPFTEIDSIIQKSDHSDEPPTEVTYDHGDRTSSFHATFKNIVDRPKGILIALENVKYNPPDPDTELKYWSDMAFLAWSEPAADPEKRGGDLEYVLRWTITNNDTVKTASKVLLNYRVEQQKPDENWRPVWPGISFEADSEQAHALLGTPNGSGVAWFLIQHKRQLGHKVVRKVTLFYTFRGPKTTGIECKPNLLFHLGNMDS